MKGKVFKSIVLVIATMLMVAGGVSASSSDEIPWAGPTTLPDYIGAPAKAHPTANSGVPQNRYLLINPFSMVHMDNWNSDVVDIPGTLGRNPVAFSSTLATGRRNPASDMFECVGMTFTSHGRMITSCFGVDEASVVLLDPETLEVYDSVLLPAVLPEDVGGDHKLSAITNGLSASYIIVDNQERFFISIAGNKIIALVEGGSEDSPTLEIDAAHTYDLSLNGWVTPNKRISGLVMDFQGRIWFYLSGSIEPQIAGAVGVLDPAKYPDVDAVKFYTFDQDEQVRNSLAIARNAMYVVTSKQMYRIWFRPDGELDKVWVARYENAGYIKPGQYNAGSGTTPTILGEGRYVAITDNAEPDMQVVVYRTNPQSDPEDQIVCEVPVFTDAQGGALDNSLNGLGLSLIVENNYGYEIDFENMETTASEPGFERIDIDPNGKGCTKIWENKQVVSTTSGKVSTRTGLFYTYARQYDNQYQVWAYYWTALDFRTGEVVWQKLAGTGDNRFDSSWPALYVGPNETLYVGLYGGLAAIRDTR